MLSTGSVSKGCLAGVLLGVTVMESGVVDVTVCCTPTSNILYADNKRKEMVYLMMHSTHFIYEYMIMEIWLRTIQNND